MSAGVQNSGDWDRCLVVREPGVSVTVPPSTSWWPPSVPRCQALWMLLVKFSEESGIQDVVTWDPALLLWSIPLPVYEVFEVASTTSRVQHLLYCVDGFCVHNLRYWGFVTDTRLCRGNKNRRKVRFKQGYMKSGMNSEVCGEL